MNHFNPVHPLKTRAKILLSSVFGPYAQDDDYGSRKINPMELYQNQVTRVQGSFSLRMFHRSFGLSMIQENIDAPCTVLDFPSLDRFIKEVKETRYDIVGIGSIAPNVGKVKKMCEVVRQFLPKATIVIGGHIANKEDLSEIVDADYIAKGEGIRWFRKFLGQDEKAPIKHPPVYSGFGFRTIGYTLVDRPGDTAAALIPTVGCPMGCNFCATSAFFGGKGQFVHFYETGQALFDVMCELEKKLKVHSFFILDENFLFYRKRALELLELMEKNNKIWGLSVFSSANVLLTYTIEQLLGLGIGWVWMGLEGRESQYRKLRKVNTQELVKELQSNGIRVLGSSIIGMENHTLQNIDGVIDYAVRHDPVFHQFMLYTAVSGTPLYYQLKQEGKLYSESEFSVADAHGQYRFNYRHPHIMDGQEERYILDAFNRDFDVNGPSLARLIRVLLTGWQKYKLLPDRRIRDRFAWEVKPIKTVYAGVVWAMRKWFCDNKAIEKKLDVLLADIYNEFGWKTKIIAPVIGRYLYLMIKKEEDRLANGWTYEPATFYEKNEAACALQKTDMKSVNPNVPEFRWVPPNSSR